MNCPICGADLAADICICPKCLSTISVERPSTNGLSYDKRLLYAAVVPLLPFILVFCITIPFSHGTVGVGFDLLEAIVYFSIFCIIATLALAIVALPGSDSRVLLVLRGYGSMLAVLLLAAAVASVMYHPYRAVSIILAALMLLPYAALFLAFYKFLVIQDSYDKATILLSSAIIAVLLLSGGMCVLATSVVYLRFLLALVFLGSYAFIVKRYSRSRFFSIRWLGKLSLVLTIIWVAGLVLLILRDAT